MIPLAWIKIVPWRLVGAAGLVVAGSLMGLRVRAWHEAYKALPDVQAALAREEACGEGSKCDGRQQALEAAQTLVTQKVVANYEAELEALRNRPVPRTVRLRCTASTGPVRVRSPTGGADGGAAATDEFPAEAGRPVDVEALYQLAKDADEQVALRRALMQWNRALSAVE